MQNHACKHFQESTTPINFSCYLQKEQEDLKAKPLGFQGPDPDTQSHGLPDYSISIRFILMHFHIYIYLYQSCISELVFSSEGFIFKSEVFYMKQKIVF